MADELKTLKYKRGSIKASITRLNSYYNSIKNLPVVSLEQIEQLSSRLADVSPFICDINQIQEQIDLLLLSKDPPDGVSADEYEESIISRSSSERNDFETSYHSIVAQIRVFISQHKAIELTVDSNLSPSSSHPSSQLSQPNNGVASTVKFPQINLPTYTGNYQEWMEFHDIFQSLIHNNTNLDDVQKFYYLKSCLKGEAANVVRSLEVSANNYTVAWNLLNDRFENKRLITSSHIKSILDLDKVTKESPAALRKLSDELNKHIRCLKSLGHPVSSWDTLLIQIIVSKLDQVTRREWEQAQIEGDYPTIEEFLLFFKRRCELLEAIQTSNVPTNSNPRENNKFNVKSPRDGYQSHSTHNYHATETEQRCIFCEQCHIIYNCPKFLNLSVQNRIGEVKKLRLCFNCLRNNHVIKDCRAISCRKCSKKHHTLLHIESNSNLNNSSEHSQESTPSINQPTTERGPVSLHAFNPKAVTQTLLATALVLIKDQYNNLQVCRALLDSGSQSNFITESCCARLNLKKENTNCIISGIAQNISNISFKTNVEIHSMRNQYKNNISCLVLKRITGNLPTFSLPSSTLNIPNNIQLADPNFHTPGEIDLLLGATVFWSILCAGQISLGSNHPVLRKTIFGWVLAGQFSMNVPDATLSLTTNVYHSVENPSIEDISKFWELEEANPCQRHPSGVDDIIETHYIQHTKRNNTGRFIVSIPFTENVSLLGESRSIALKRLHGIEKKLSKNFDLKQRYDAFIREYLALGHMSLVSESVIPDKSCYLPHHCVFKESSTTTKLRVVFDASAKTGSGLSLNDVQMIGPVLQRDLFSLLLNFRNHTFVLTADCEKMYRQILISSRDRDYHRILWRFNPAENVQCFRLNTVTYGTASASFLATRVMKHLADDFQSILPKAAYVIQNNFYMDDLLTGADSVEELLNIKSDVSFILEQGGFSLRKWSSNSFSVTASDLDQNISFGKDVSQSTLGILWNSNQDCLRYSIKPFDIDGVITKRSILSTASQIFDPLGLIAPVTTVAKLMMQSIWQLKLSWDESIPLDLQTRWINFRDHLQEISNISIPRHTLIPSRSSVELHGFADASQKAYGACLYLRSIDAYGNIVVRLLCAKSKVAPIKNTTTLPRLELCACVLLANLAHRVLSLLEIDINECFFYSDSTIALCWLKSEPHRWKTFVGNRVSEVQRLTRVDAWRHVRSNENPADLISRGTTPKALLESSIWWQGPDWLSSSSELYLNNDVPSEQYDLSELKPQTLSFVVTQSLVDVSNKFSSFKKLIRVMSYCFRFISNLRLKIKGLPIKVDSLSINELDHASQRILSFLQQECFVNEIKALSSDTPLDRKSRLLCLNPFIGEDRLLRVGGRLGNSELPYDNMHPILLPKHHHITKLIARDEHIKLLHCGPQQLLFSLRQRYWPLSGYNLAKQTVHQCSICFKANPKPLKQIMGSLPKSRFIGNYPFETTGVDYAGPFQLRDRKTRGFKIIKGYIAIFICFLTKAIHLELVTELTSDYFIAALRRFVSRRGKPTSIHSDNGTNFVGANSKLKELFTFLSDNSHKKTIIDWAANEGIEWSYIPPRAPHFGGLWESGVRSIKHHLTRVIGNNSLTYENFCTVLLQIEAVLNSRPLYPFSSDPQDPNPLTPGHFLIARPITSVLDQPLQHIPDSRLKSYQRCQKMVQAFWNKWRKDYLNHLQVRTKWKVKTPAIKIGDLVVIKEDNLRPCHWKLGRIQELHNGPDDLPRVVTLRCENTIVKRPITKICPLPREEKDM